MYLEIWTIPHKTLASWMMYLPIYDLRNERPIKMMDLLKTPIRDFLSTGIAKLEDFGATN